MKKHRLTFAEINLEALRFNVKQVQRLSHNKPILSVVKANAYGHGVMPCVETIQSCGVKHFAVATVEEGLYLRDKGVKDKIYILGGLLTDNLKVFSEYNLTPFLHHWGDFDRLDSYYKEGGPSFPLHLKFDTGMGRLGFFSSELNEVLRRLDGFSSSLKVEGVLSHLGTADTAPNDLNQKQYLQFQKIKSAFQKRNIPVYHLANSAAVLDQKCEESEWVRPGIMQYGAYPNPRQIPLADLKPVMSLKTSIMSIKKYPKGATLSYGASYQTKKESLIATLPFGYADGYPRLVSNRAYVLVAGKKAPVVGRVCMDLTLIDISDIPQAKLGEEVCLFGESKNSLLRAEELADWAETISYEIFCGVSSRVPRIYKN